MKKIYLIGFRGTGFRDTRFKDEPALIRAGHVGIAFEDDPKRIFGFHPTEDAVDALGGDEATITWLKKLNPMPGALYDDTDIFQRAYELAQVDPRTTVWEMEIPIADEEFERIKTLTLLWYTERKIFTYSFPPEELLPDRDNCATFPRRLGIPLPETTGQLVFYIPELAKWGNEWHPRENER